MSRSNGFIRTERTCKISKCNSGLCAFKRTRGAVVRLTGISPDVVPGPHFRHQTLPCRTIIGSRRTDKAMNAWKTRPNVIPWPPMLVAGFAIAAIVLNTLHPLSFSVPGGFMVGAAVMALAVGIDLWALKTLHDGKTTVLPNRGSSHLVIRGPFKYSRNPIYFANLVLLFGAGLYSGNAWFLIAVPLNALATQFLAIRREENHLLAQFGYQYEMYCRKVRRWV